MSDAVLNEDRLSGKMSVLDWDGLFTFALFATLLFIVEFGSYGALLFVISTCGYAFVRRASLAAILRGRAFLLMLPAFALLSALWSDVPLETVKHSLEFGVTIFAAMLVAAPRNPRAMIFGLFAAFLIFSAISLVMGHHVDVGDYGARAFSGLNDSKNEEADMAGTGLVISFFVLISGIARRNPFEAALAGAAVLLQGYILGAALSAGALAGTGLAIAALLFLLLMRRAGAHSRAVMLGAAGVLAVGTVLLFETSGNALVQSIAHVFGKDPTLTGRTYLWFRARDFVVENPLFGKGFGAFWQQGNLDAEGLWQYAGITTREGFNFHNTLYDSLVSLGWIGTVIYAMTFAIGALRCGIRYVREPSLIACFWLAIVALRLSHIPTECEGLTEFYFSTVLLFAALGSASRAKPSPEPLQSGALSPMGGLRPPRTTLAVPGTISYAHGGVESGRAK